MKKSYLKELSRQLLGSVTDNAEALDYFSTDLSIFQITPTAVVYPANTADVRKTVQFVADRAAAGKPLSLVPRGHGSDTGGGAIGEGLQVIFPAHMNKLLRLDHDSVTVQPGILYRTLQQTLHTHGRFLPAYPAGINHATIGGAVANNASGEKSLKYGSTRDFVKSLKVVLSDGSLIETHRISARELGRKKGLSTLEGEIYRHFDSLLLDHAALIKQHQPHTTKNTAGYALAQVRRKDGSFDLSQVFIGSQGTLGLITEVTLKIVPYSPRTTLVVGYFDSLPQAGAAIIKLRALKPSALEMVNYHLLEHLHTEHPGDIEGLVPDPLPKIMLFIEFDEFSQLTQKVKTVRAQRLLARHGATSRVSTAPLEQAALWKIRRNTAAVTWLGGGSRPALPFIEDSIVPADQLVPFLDKTYKLLAKHDLPAAIWGHAGDANLCLQPALDPSKKKDVAKLFTLAREFHEMVIALGGSTSAGSGEGLLRPIYLEKLYGQEMVELFATTKHIFDPHSLLNPHQKTEATEAYARDHLRSEYSLKHFDRLLDS